MTKRQRFLKAMRNEPVDGLVWAPNFDYWLNVNRAEGTLPEQYVGMSRNDIVRAIGGTIWHRSRGMKSVLDGTVRHESRDVGDDVVQEYHTPVGSIRQVYGNTEGRHRSKALVEHYVKDLDSLRVLKYVVEATHYEADYEPVRQALQDTGDDGVVVNQSHCVPFLQFAKTDAGYMNGILMWHDYREEVDGLINLYFEKYLQAYAVLADGPADVLAICDNMDGVMVSPSIFREYAAPFYREVKKIASPKGKILEAHWCGRTETLLGLVPGTGIDVLEAIVTRPMSAITMEEALNLVRGEVAIQGGVPSVAVCAEGFTDGQFEQYLAENVLPLKGRRGFILGMGDNVPPNAVFRRVEQVARLIQ